MSLPYQLFIALRYLKSKRKHKGISFNAAISIGGVALGVMAMQTDTALFLPFFGFVLAMESVTVIIQLVSKKFFKKKVFLSTPIHHHFEAIGWPESQVTMRFWIVGAVMTILGLVLFFLAHVI